MGIGTQWQHSAREKGKGVAGCGEHKALTRGVCVQGVALIEIIEKKG